ncbi:MAG TPA: hypothetical protein VNE00_06535 [Paraburkholderia sp.]|jgi:hypothetical protein|nr:hypothetical protein [Paraburkholderia sp.]
MSSARIAGMLPQLRAEFPARHLAACFYRQIKLSFAFLLEAPRGHAADFQSALSVAGRSCGINVPS